MIHIRKVSMHYVLGESRVRVLGEVDLGNNDSPTCTAITPHRLPVISLIPGFTALENVAL